MHSILGSGRDPLVSLSLARALPASVVGKPIEVRVGRRTLWTEPHGTTESTLRWQPCLRSVRVNEELSWQPRADWGASSA